VPCLWCLRIAFKRSQLSNVVLAHSCITKMTSITKPWTLSIWCISIGQLVLGFCLAAIAHATPLNVSGQVLPHNSSSNPSNNKNFIVPEDSLALDPLISPEQPDFKPVNEELSKESSRAAVTFTTGTVVNEVARHSSPQVAQSEPVSLPKAKPAQADPKEAEFKIPPHVVEKAKLNPFTTTLILNGTPISHLTKWELATGYEFGEGKKDNFTQTGVIAITSEVKESLTRKNVYTVDQSGRYLQLRSLKKSRTVSVAQRDPQTLTGLKIQLSFTGSCIFPGQKSTDQCTYTPGLVTDDKSIDPDFLVPTRILQLSNVGDVVTPESLAVMRLPGFQRGANGQDIGVDLNFPNAGVRPGNSQSTQRTMSREEAVDNVPAATYSRVRQVVKANHRKAVIGRTIHGFTAIPEDKNTVLNSALQLGAQLLPDVEPHLEGSDIVVNPNVNKNLFLAANNTRIPEGGLTIYQAGLGSADSLKASATQLKDIPVATFNSVWFGLSPVTERRYLKGIRYETTGAQVALASSGAEGGLDSNAEFTSRVNTEQFSTNQIQDFYTQIYLSFYNQNANLVTTTQLVEKTSYFPHIGFSGNITGSSDVFRYYAGVIATTEPKVYLGLDYTKSTRSGWNYTIGGIGYLNPDRDYYSQLQSSLSKKISLGHGNKFTLATGLNYAIDRETQIGSTTIISPASSVTVSASTQLGPVTFGVVQYFGGILPSSVKNMLSVNLEVRPHKNVRLSAYATPISENSDRTRYGATAQFKLGSHYNSPALSFAWSNNEYDLGVDSEGKALQSINNVFSITFKLGEPASPFDAESAKRMKQQLEQESERYLNERNKVIQEH
jgi:hypothetical protein